MLGLLAVHALFELSVLFFQYIFWIDENNVYHRENFYWIYITVFVITILYCYISIIAGNKRFLTNLGFVDILILILLSFGIGVQMVYSYITVDFMCVSIGNFFLYHYYGNIINQIDVTDIFGVSLGYAFYDKTETDINSTIKKADTMMYENKRKKAVL